MSGTTHNPGSLNQASAHDTGLYDPTIHDNQIVALYDTDAHARSAQEMLTTAGFPASCMQIVARDASNTGTTSASGAADEGMWGSIKSLFVPDEDRTTYNTAVNRGHAMLVVTPDRTMDRQHLIHTLESTNPLDFDSKLEEWRQAGYDTTGAATGSTTSNVATAGHAVDAGMNTKAADMTPGTATPPATVTNMGKPAVTTAGMGKSGMGTAGMGTAGATNPGTSNTAATTPAMTGKGTVTPGTGSSDTIQLMEERLRVGKREVAAGAVRIRSYIVERPVEEQISLHEEHVSVERHPVDRPVNPADMGAFEERTIEARATSEEAVVTKEARVVEEIGLRKEASDRVETIHDTVRKTEVEIEGDTASRTGTLPGKTGTQPGATKPTPANPNSTPGATSSGMNSPRK